MKNYTNNEAKKTAMDGLMLAVGLAAVAFLSSGCSGMELRATAGIHRVDESAYTQKTYRQAIPWKCYFVSCPSAAEDVQGS